MSGCDRPSPPIDYALTVPLDALSEYGFGPSDIKRYVAWTRGQTLKPPPDATEIARFGLLQTMVIVTVEP